MIILRDNETSELKPKEEVTKAAKLLLAAADKQASGTFTRKDLRKLDASLNEFGCTISWYPWQGDDNASTLTNAYAEIAAGIIIKYNLCTANCSHVSIPNAAKSIAKGRGYSRTCRACAWTHKQCDDKARLYPS